MMLPPMALPSMSWMLLSCLMVLSQVRGELALSVALGPCECSGPRGRKKAPVVMVTYLPTQ